MNDNSAAPSSDRSPLRASGAAPAAPAPHVPLRASGAAADSAPAPHVSHVSQAPHVPHAAHAAHAAQAVDLPSPAAGEQARPARVDGKLCVVTGATAGIGFEIALGLARRGARVIGVGRDPERCAAAAARLRAESGNEAIEMEVADLSSQAAVRDLARRLSARGVPIDVLVNNAGLFASRRRLTSDGAELQLAVNYLAVFLLSGLLLPSAARGMRIITVSSGSHFSGRIHFRNINLAGPYLGLGAYGQSKLATVLFTYELARRLGPGSRISVYAADPGLVNTDIGLKGTGVFVRWFWGRRSRGGVSARESAAPIVELAASPELDGATGRYWRAGQAVSSSRRSYDEAAARRLWELSERLCRFRFLLPDGSAR